jgi:hypothetical protein
VVITPRAGTTHQKGKDLAQLSLVVRRILKFFLAQFGAEFRHADLNVRGLEDCIREGFTSKSA